MKPSPYWGFRATYWSRRKPSFGAMYDFTHDKAIMIKPQQVKQSGTRDGKPVPPLELISETFEQVNFRHGLNYNTLNAVFRLENLRPRITPYAGVGVGLMAPFVFVERKGQTKAERTYKRKITGLTFQVLGGIDWRVLLPDRISIFSEYKMNYSMSDAPLKGGGSLKNNFLANQIIPFGFTFRAPLPGGSPARRPRRAYGPPQPPVLP